MSDFDHQALNLAGDKPLIYTAASKHLFYYRMFISKFVLERGGVPLNPFMIFDYFLLDAVERDAVRSGNNSLVKRCDEIWVFGPVSDGVLAEIKLAKNMDKPLRYFQIEKNNISEISRDQVILEDDVAGYRDEL